MKLLSSYLNPILPLNWTSKHPFSTLPWALGQLIFSLHVRLHSVSHSVSSGCLVSDLIRSCGFLSSLLHLLCKHRIPTNRTIKMFNPRLYVHIGTYKLYHSISGPEGMCTHYIMTGHDWSVLHRSSVLIVAVLLDKLQDI